METDYSKYFLPAVLVIAILGLVYVGAQSISGEVVLNKVCNEEDGGKDVTSSATRCYDDYGTHSDACTKDATKVMEYYCTSDRCVWEPIKCPAGTECKLGVCA